MFNKLDADDDKTLAYSEFTDMMILDDMCRFNAVVHMYDQKPLPQVEVTEAGGPPELETIDDVVVVEGSDMYVAISRSKSTAQMFKRRSRTFVKHHDLAIEGGIKSVESLPGTHSILILPHQFVDQVWHAAVCMASVFGWACRKHAWYAVSTSASIRHTHVVRA